MYKNLLLFIPLFIIFILPTKNFAQSKFEKGCIIKLNGDTINGYISYKNGDKNPESFWFKRDINGEKSKYYPRHVLNFIVTDRLYSSNIVPIIRSLKKKQLIDHAEITSSSKVETDTVFLEVLCIGKANLFYFSELNNQEHFFIETDSIFDELVFSDSYLTSNGSAQKMAEFKGQLNMYLKDCQEINNKIDQAKFTKKGLINVLTHYNNCISDGSKYVQKVEKAELQFYALGGISSTGISFEGTSYHQDQLKDIDFSRSLNPDLAFALNIVLPGTQKSVSLYNEILYSSNKFDEDYKDIDNIITNYKIEYSYLKLSHLLRYTYPKGNLKPFINAGISNGLALNDNNSKYVKSINGTPQPKEESAIFGNLKNYELSYLLGIGLSYKRFSLEARYEQSNGTATHDYGYLTTRANRLHLLLGFKLHK